MMQHNLTPSNSLHKRQSEDNNFNATYTQILSWKIVKATRLNVKEKTYVFEVLQKLNKPYSRRQIQELTDLPVNHLTRVFKDLMNEGLVYVAKLDKCQYTNRLVQFYSPLKPLTHE